MIDFQEELAIDSFILDNYIIHRRRSIRVGSKSYNTRYCGNWVYSFPSIYKKGTQYSDICKKCLKSYSMEEIKQLKHFLIVQKLKGK